MEPGVFSESFKIRAIEVDASGKATLPAVSNLLQEVAGNHALELQFDITDLHKQGLTWVLHRMHIKMDSYPDWRDTVVVETWPAAGDAFRAYRDYKIMDSDGQVHGVALSYWMMINLETRRPVRMPKEVLDLRLSGRDHVLPIRNDRIAIKQDWEPKSTFHARKSDLDMNQHVNNVTYVQWICDTMSSESSTIKEMNIQFLLESRAGDELSCLSNTGDGSNYFMLKNASTEKPVAIASVII